MSSLEALAQEAIRAHGRSIVTVVIHKKKETLSATGFIVRSTGNTGLVMTCSHVTGCFQAFKQDRLCVRLPGADVECKGKPMWHDEQADVAIISVSEMPTGYPALKWADGETLEIGTQIVLLAYYHPDNLAGHRNPIPMNPGSCPGVIAGPPYLKKGVTRWVTTIRYNFPGMSGCSGGAVIYNGSVVGVHGGSNTQIGYATSTETVKKVLKSDLYIDDDADVTMESLLERLCMSYETDRDESFEETSTPPSTSK